jgi:hypothetical protein
MVKQGQAAAGTATVMSGGRAARPSSRP